MEKKTFEVRRKAVREYGYRATPVDIGWNAAQWATMHVMPGSVAVLALQQDAGDEVMPVTAWSHRAHRNVLHGWTGLRFRSEAQAKT